MKKVISVIILICLVFCNAGCLALASTDLILVDEELIPIFGLLFDNVKQEKAQNFSLRPGESHKIELSVPSVVQIIGSFCVISDDTGDEWTETPLLMVGDGYENSMVVSCLPAGEYTIEKSSSDSTEYNDAKISQVFVYHQGEVPLAILKKAKIITKAKFRFDGIMSFGDFAYSFGFDAEMDAENGQIRAMPMW